MNTPSPQPTQVREPAQAGEQVHAGEPNQNAYSLRRRLLLWLLIPLCTIGVIALADAYRSARQTANEIFDRVLTGSALAIAERVFVNEDGDLDVDIPYVALDMLTSAAQDRVFYRLEGANGRFVTGYEKLVLPELSSRTSDRFSYSDSVFRGTPIRIASYSGVASTSDAPVSFRIAVAETTNARNRLTTELLVRTAIRQALLIGVAAIIVWIAVTRALIPFRRLGEAIDRRSLDDLRPIFHRVPAEVSGLVGTINSFMHRLDYALSALRHFTANASHQIRTPLAIMRTHLALAQRAETPEDIQAALNACDRAIIDAERTLSQLLLLARIDEASSHALAEQEASLSEIAKDVVEENIIRATEAGFDLGFEGTDAIACKGDEVLLHELISNLVDNAIKHGTDGDTITVRVAQMEGRPVLQVEDNGSGIPPEFQEEAFQRFSGNDSSATTGSEKIRDVNSGLGLSIVAEIAHLFHGNVALKSGDGGSGFLVNVTLQSV